MRFNKILDLTAGMSVFLFYIYWSPLCEYIVGMKLRQINKPSNKMKNLMNYQMEKYLKLDKKTTGKG